MWLIKAEGKRPAKKAAGKNRKKKHDKNIK